MPSSQFYAIHWSFVTCTSRSLTSKLEDALTVILQQGFQETRGRDCYVDKEATIAPLGWPGYRLISSELLPPTVMLVPASFWHMDLSVSSISENTFLHPATRCRFPKRLFYLDALVNAIVEGALKPGWNILVSGYFKIQYHYLLACLSPDTIIGLPPEDKFFVDLYGRLLPPSTRQKLLNSMPYGTKFGAMASVVIWLHKALAETFVLDVHLGLDTLERRLVTKANVLRLRAGIRLVRVNMEEGRSNHLNGPAKKRMAMKLILVMWFVTLVFLVALRTKKAIRDEARAVGKFRKRLDSAQLRRRKAYEERKRKRDEEVDSEQPDIDDDDGGWIDDREDTRPQPLKSIKQLLNESGFELQPAELVTTFNQSQKGITAKLNRAAGRASREKYHQKIKEEYKGYCSLQKIPHIGNDGILLIDFDGI
ncbi:hypothetical protein V1523DRAFT_428546 [Lipomyces doorenjongii]